MKSCPLCKQAGRSDSHFLSHCPFLPAEDRSYLSKSRLTTSALDDEPLAETSPPFSDDEYDPGPPSARVISRRVSTQRSPHFKAYYRQTPVLLTLDTGAETSMIKSSVAHSLGAHITKSSQQALQADGVTPMSVVGETRIILSRSGNQLVLDALVVDDLDVDVLAGNPFLITNDISLRPSKCQINIRDTETVHYEYHKAPQSSVHTVRRAQSYVIRTLSNASVLWPGEFIELDLPSDLGEDQSIAIEPHATDPKSARHKDPNAWPPPQIVDAVGTKIRLLNATDQPQPIRRHEHICTARHTSTAPPATSAVPCLSPPVVNCKNPRPFSSTVSLDPDGLLTPTQRQAFAIVLHDFDTVFDPQITRYNGAAGPIEATVNIGPTQPPQRKGCVPQYSRNQLTELQA